MSGYINPFYVLYHITLIFSIQDNLIMATRFSKSLGNRIRYFRELRGFTQEKLAELIECETSTLGHVETGKNLPSLSRLEKMAKVLDIEVYQLFIKKNIEPGDDLRDAIADLLKSADTKQLRLIYECLTNILDITARK